jgi:hypothetical protein
MVGQAVARSGEVVDGAQIATIDYASQGGVSRPISATVTLGAGGTSRGLLRVAPDGAKSLPLRTGDAAPDGNGAFSSFFNLAAAGEYTSFVSGLSGTSGGSADSTGIYRPRRHLWRVENRARQDALPAGDSGTFRSFPGTVATASGGIGFEANVRVGTTTCAGCTSSPATVKSAG